MCEPLPSGRLQKQQDLPACVVGATSHMGLPAYTKPLDFVVALGSLLPIASPSSSLA